MVKTYGGAPVGRKSFRLLRTRNPTARVRSPRRTSFGSSQDSFGQGNGENQRLEPLGARWFCEHVLEEPAIHFVPSFREFSRMTQHNSRSTRLLLTGDTNRNQDLHRMQALTPEYCCGNLADPSSHLIRPSPSTLSEKGQFRCRGSKIMASGQSDRCSRFDSGGLECDSPQNTHRTLAATPSNGHSHR